MAKFNIEVNLDYIDENGTIDEILKEEIISNITKRISDTTMQRIDKQIDERVEEYANEAEKMIGGKLSALMEDFLNRKRTITDKYGDVERSDISVIDMLKSACDNFIEGRVDREGNSVNSKPYYGGNTKRRIDYIIEKQIDYTMKRSIEKAAEEIKIGLQKHIDETLKSQIGENVAKIIGLDKIVKNI